MTHGESNGGLGDYALFTIADFDYHNAHVKTLFSGLNLQETLNKKRENIYIPQHGGAKPLQISALLRDSIDLFASINPDIQEGTLLIYGDMEAGSSDP